MNVNNSIDNSVNGFNHYKKSIKEKSHENTFDNLISKSMSSNEKSYNKDEDTFKKIAPNAPSSVKEAWNKATKETGVNGFGIGEDGKLTHISQLYVMSSNKLLLTGHFGDIFGNSKESAINAVSEALYNVNNPLVPSTDPKIINHKNKEKAFYEAFIRYLKEN